MSIETLQFPLLKQVISAAGAFRKQLLKAVSRLPDDVTAVIDKHLRTDRFPFISCRSPLSDVFFHFPVSSGIVRNLPPLRQRDFSRVAFTVHMKAAAYHLIKITLHNAPLSELSRELSQVFTTAKARIINLYKPVIMEKFRVNPPDRALLRYSDELGYEAPYTSREWMLHMLAQNRVCEDIIMPMNLLYAFYEQRQVDWNVPGWCYSVRGIKRWAALSLGPQVCWQASEAAIWAFLRSLWWPQKHIAAMVYDFQNKLFFTNYKHAPHTISHLFVVPRRLESVQVRAPNVIPLHEAF